MDIIICPRCGAKEMATMDIQQVCQNCGYILRKQTTERGEMMNRKTMLAVVYAAGIGLVIGLMIWLFAGLA
jgi:ribosomal protein L37E